jgi:oxygen-independent coproporphyrinogen-3 oxidase
VEGASLRVDRSVRTREPRRYLSELAADLRPPAHRTVPASDLPFEFLLNALRLNEGFEPAAFEARTGVPFQSIAAPCALAMTRGLIHSDGRRWSATTKGLNFLNDLQAIFLPQTVGSAEGALSEPAGSQ